MSLAASTFDYLKPTDAQLAQMAHLRSAAAEYAGLLDRELPEGPDKTYVLRRFRELTMWVNVAITRNSDGSPRP